MRYQFMATTMAGMMLLAGCGEKAATNSSGIAESGKPVKRQPGSWSQKIEIVKLEGKDVKAEDKKQMQAMFDMMSGMSVCLTPEASAQEDVAKNLEQMGTQGGECTFAEKDISGNKMSFVATCKGPAGGGMKLAAEGINDATTQDITISTSATKADGTPEGQMVMHITGKRTGECKAGDITPPMPKAAT